MNYSTLRRRLLAVVLIIGVLLLAAPALRAQLQFGCSDQSCYPFSSIETITLTLPGGCIVRVHYTWRYGCYGRPGEFSIKMIEPLSGCGGLSNGQLMNLSSRALLTQNPSPFPVFPNPFDTCVYMMRVLDGSCWRFIENPCFPGDSILVPCDSNVCCRSYRVCRDFAGNNTVTLVLSFGTYTCDPFPPPSPGSPCYPICADTSGEVMMSAAPDDHHPEVSQRWSGEGSQNSDGREAQRNADEGVAPASPSRSADARSPQPIAEPVSQKRAEPVSAPSQPLHQRHR